MIERQLELDLQDKFQKFERIAKNMVKDCGSCETVQLYATQNPDVWWIGIRTFLYETSHDYIHKIDWDVAKYLYQNVSGVSDRFDVINARISKEETE